MLMKSAALRKETLREIDVAARYGGEEFAVVLPETPRTGATWWPSASARASRSTSSAGAPLRRHRLGRRRHLPRGRRHREELVRRADEALYRSKAAGKNRITLAHGERRRCAARGYSVSVTAPGPAALPRVKNVSEGGLLVSLREAVPIGSPVSLRSNARRRHAARPARRGGARRRVPGEVEPASTSASASSTPSRRCRCSRAAEAPFRRKAPGAARRS